MILLSILFVLDLVLAENLLINPGQNVRKAATSPHDPNYVYIEIQPKPANFSLEFDLLLNLEVCQI